MSNLQYIGARYVPAFYENPDTGDMTWKSGVGYEPLTVVTYNSDTYTSKKPVPSSVGDPASNPTYWAKTADYNAALVSLQNQVNNIDNVEIPAINDRLDNLRSFKNILVVADSFGHTPSASDNFIDKINSLLLPDHIYRSVEGGAGFVRTGNDGHTLRQNYTTLTNSLTSDERNAVDLVIVVGGTNDTRTDITLADFRYAVSNVAKDIKTKYKNAVGIIAYNGNMFSTSIAVNRKQLKAAFRNEIIQWASAYGCIGTYLDTIMQIKGATNMSDGVHPTSNGAYFIAECLINIASGGQILDVVTSWNESPVNFVSAGINPYYELVGGGTLFDDSANPIELHGSFEYMGTFANVPVPIENFVILFHPAYVTITLSNSTTQQITDAIIGYRSDGRLAIMRYGGTVANVVKVVMGVIPCRTYINALSDI